MPTKEWLDWLRQRSPRRLRTSGRRWRTTTECGRYAFADEIEEMRHAKRARLDFGWFCLIVIGDVIVVEKAERGVVLLVCYHVVEFGVVK